MADYRIQDLETVPDSLQDADLFLVKIKKRQTTLGDEDRNITYAKLKENLGLGVFLRTSGGRMTGPLEMSNNVPLKALTNTGTPVNAMVMDTKDNLIIGTQSTSVKLQSQGVLTVTRGGVDYKLYSEYNKPTAADVGAYAKDEAEAKFVLREHAKAAGFNTNLKTAPYLRHDDNSIVEIVPKTFTINTVAMSGTGITLTPANIGAAPANHTHALPTMVNTVNGHSGTVLLTAADVGALPIVGGAITGNLTVDGWLKVKGAITTQSQVSYRHEFGNYGVMWENDGGGRYSMRFTKAGEPAGLPTNNSPFSVTMASGIVNFDLGLDAIGNAKFHGDFIANGVNSRFDNSLTVKGLFKKVGPSGIQIDSTEEVTGRSFTMLNQNGKLSMINLNETRGYNPIEIQSSDLLFVGTGAIKSNRFLFTAAQGTEANSGVRKDYLDAAVTKLTDALAVVEGKIPALDAHQNMYAPLVHIHAIADVTNLQTTLNSKAPAGYGLGESSSRVSGQPVVDLASIQPNGWYRYTNVANAASTAPYGQSNGVYLSTGDQEQAKNSPLWGKQMFFGLNAEDVFVRSNKNVNTYTGSDWRKFITAAVDAATGALTVDLGINDKLNIGSLVMTGAQSAAAGAAIRKDYFDRQISQLASANHTHTLAGITDWAAKEAELKDLITASGGVTSHHTHTVADITDLETKYYARKAGVDIMPRSMAITGDGFTVGGPIKHNVVLGMNAWQISSTNSIMEIQSRNADSANSKATVSLSAIGRDSANAQQVLNVYVNSDGSISLVKTRANNTETGKFYTSFDKPTVDEIGAAPTNHNHIGTAREASAITMAAFGITANTNGGWAVSNSDIGIIDYGTHYQLTGKLNRLPSHTGAVDTTILSSTGAGLSILQLHATPAVGKLADGSLVPLYIEDNIVTKVICPLGAHASTVQTVFVDLTFWKIA